MPSLWADSLAIGVKENNGHIKPERLRLRETIANALKFSCYYTSISYDLLVDILRLISNLKMDIPNLSSFPINLTISPLHTFALADPWPMPYPSL